jgi:hypothetical protein
VESHFFWFSATITCLLAIGFAARQRQLAKDALKARHESLVRSQAKDNWLNCVVVWGVILCSHTEFASTLEMVGAMILSWLAWRTLRRVAVLR